MTPQRTSPKNSLGPGVLWICLAATLLLCGCNSSTPPPEHADHDHAGHAHASGSSEPSQATSTTARCTVHNAPEHLCFICNPELRDAGRLWCNEHARYEDRCWLCHPDVQDKNRPFCTEHSLYEDECFLCNPALASDSTATTASGHDHSSTLMCEEHGVLEAECGICRPELTATLKPGEALKVRLPAKDSAQSAGVQTAKPAKGNIEEGVHCYAELTFNQNRLAHIVAPVRGIVQAVSADLGSRVLDQDTVASLWSADIAEAVAKAVLSHQTLDRERRLREQRITSEQALQQAEADHRAACQTLRTLGFTEEQIDTLGDQPHEQVLMHVRAPFAGEIVERSAVLGTLVEAGTTLFRLADRSVMWAMLNIPESELPLVSIGQQVELRFDSLPGQVFTGTLTWIGADVDDRTRMARARVELPNPGEVLKANMFARATILIRSSTGALLLPDTAIQQIEGEPLVFIKMEDDLYEARRITIGSRSNGLSEILAGLSPSDDVATENVFALKSQLLASRLGAGCAHE